MTQRFSFSYIYYYYYFFFMLRKVMQKNIQKYIRQTNSKRESVDWSKGKQVI